MHCGHLAFSRGDESRGTSHDLLATDIHKRGLVLQNDNSLERAAAGDPRRVTDDLGNWIRMFPMKEDASFKRFCTTRIPIFNGRIQRRTSFLDEGPRHNPVAAAMLHDRIECITAVKREPRQDGPIRAFETGTDCPSSFFRLRQAPTFDCHGDATTRHPRFT
jgi:hypothetical protein